MKLKRLVAIILVFLISSGTTVYARDPLTPLYYDYVNEIADYLVSDYYFGIEREVLINAALKAALTEPDKGIDGVVDAMLSCLDENSSFIPAKTLDSFLEQSVTGTFDGIGVMILGTNGRIVVTEPLEDSPAEKAGILPNDIIISVDGVSLDGKSVSQARELVTGEAGTEVVLEILRGKETLSITLVREKISDEVVTYSVIDGVGYIGIARFNYAMEQDVKEALSYFDSQGIDKVIIDLRGNPGGEISAVLQLCSMFVPKGVVVRQVFKDRSDVLYYSDLETPKYDLAVLINEGTASASELFAGAVDDTDVGVIIGQRSYGKGTMQHLRGLITGGAIRVTFSEYKTAGGRSVHGIGITPDIEVENETYVRDTSYFKEIDFMSEYKEGMSGDGVLAVEQRLEFLGYMTSEADGVYDAETAEAVRTFQTYRGLAVSGVCDIYTLLNLNNVDYEVEETIDVQLDTAVKYLLGKDAE